jgi:hypothetical protein
VTIYIDDITKLCRHIPILPTNNILHGDLRTFVSTWVTNVLLITRVTSIPVLKSVTVVTDGPVVTFVIVVKFVIKVTIATVLRLLQNCFDLWTYPVLCSFFLCEYSCNFSLMVPIDIRYDFFDMGSTHCEPVSYKVRYVGEHRPT